MSDVGGQRRVDQDGRGLGAQPVVLAPARAAASCPAAGYAWPDEAPRPRRARPRRQRAGRTGQARRAREPTGRGRPLSERPERLSEDTGSPRYKHPHGISFLGWRRHPADLAGRWTLTPNGAAYPACGRGGSRTSASWPMLPPGGQAKRWAGGDPHIPRHDRPPRGRLRVSSGPRSAPGHGGEMEFRFTGWLGLLRALYEVTGSPPSPADR